MHIYMYCPICNEYKGFMGEICVPCEKIKKIVELYSNEKVRFFKRKKGRKKKLIYKQFFIFN